MEENDLFTHPKRIYKWMNQAYSLTLGLHMLFLPRMLRLDIIDQKRKAEQPFLVVPVKLTKCYLCGMQGRGSALPQTDTQVNGKLPPESSVITAAQQLLP